MSNPFFRTWLYAGVALGLVRIIINIAASVYDLSLGYFFDIFIFVYVFLCLLLSKNYSSIKKIVLVTLFTGIIAVVIFDIYLVLFRQPASWKVFFGLRFIIALNILVISLLSGVLYFVTQQVLIKKKIVNRKS